MSTLDEHVAAAQTAYDGHVVHPENATTASPMHTALQALGFPQIHARLAEMGDGW